MSAALSKLRLRAPSLDRECRDPGSSRGPSDLQSDTLPTELSRLEFEKFGKILGGKTKFAFCLNCLRLVTVSFCCGPHSSHGFLLCVWAQLHPIHAFRGVSFRAETPVCVWCVRLFDAVFASTRFVGGVRTSSMMCSSPHLSLFVSSHNIMNTDAQTADVLNNAETQDRTGDLQIFSLTLSQLSYRGFKGSVRVCKL